MIPVFQTKFDEFGTGPGNCMQAATASMLELRLDQVPNFVEMADAWGAMSRFFAEFGVDLLKRPPSYVPRGPYFAVGTSTQNNYHIVIMEMGRIVHDPNPHGKGMISVEYVLWPKRFR